MGLFKKYVNQTRKPEGFLGKMMVGGMNGGHAKLADWGMSYLAIAEPSHIAELGCGGGRNTGELLKQYPSAKVTALDYSELSVEKTKDYNKEYPMNWYYYFETVPGKDEYYITHRQCGICKLTKQEHCEEITKHLCMMDYYTLEMQGAVLDRTKTLGYGDDECNFHLMSKDRAKEIGFVKSPDAK